jgi:uncharacterized protein
MNKFLRQYQNELIQFAKDNHITYLALFGSHARGEETPESDVDLLVEFDPKVDSGLTQIIQAERKISQLINKKVDLVPKDSLDKYIAPYIQDDLKIIYA